MKSTTRGFIFLLSVLFSTCCFAQADSSLPVKSNGWTKRKAVDSLAKHTGKLTYVTDSVLVTVKEVPLKYVKAVDKKVEQYSKEVSSRTFKTLERLSRWETKIKVLLEKASPPTAEQLFGNGRMTFGLLLQQLKAGETKLNEYKAGYDEYRDKLTTSIGYLSQQKENLDAKFIKPLAETRAKVTALNEKMDEVEATDQFIKERKKALISQSIQYIGQSKYLKRINKEAFYYTETLKNYKEVFHDPVKAEKAAKEILNKIPAFQQFVKKNSMLAGLFAVPDDYGSVASLAGLQTRAGIQSLIQSRIAAGGPNAMEQVRQNIEAAQGELNALKDKLLKATPGAGNGGGDLPDFKPNMQKTKAFLQRLDYGMNLQFAKGSSIIPNGTDIALTVGYKINDKSTIGIGAAYKLGIGSIQHIRISHEGIGVRSFIDWKLKKEFFVSGGYEIIHNAAFANIAELKNYNAWQRIALIGIKRKLNIQTKWFKSTNVSLLYDFLSGQHVPASQAFLFRVGYSF